MKVSQSELTELIQRVDTTRKSIWLNPDENDDPEAKFYRDIYTLLVRVRTDYQDMETYLLEREWLHREG